MSMLVETSPIQPLTDADRSMEVLSSVLVALSPDSYSFQRYLDRVTHIVAQGLHLVSGKRLVREMWAQMGFPESHVLHSTPVAAKTLFFSCRAAVSEDVRTIWRRAHGPARTHSEEGEELVVFNPDQFANVKELFAWFAANVIAVVGPHGGAMFNHRWANQDTLLLEFMPTTRLAVMIWEEASVLSQKYAAIVVERTSKGGTDMIIDVADCGFVIGSILECCRRRGSHKEKLSLESERVGVQIADGI
ncbi:hypothetical protein B0H16DRAFT_1799686 [Mycena metata]|uniref:Uncharacterized protein n=1 Tax=Mycena metata TaxID=1033252 RepID=A0AAD7NJ86_9AGAR|nr:hypothetical protein B0H16DRAFT_1799686 [Mycena metata]